MAVYGAPNFFFFYYPITSNSDMDSREIEEDRDSWMEELGGLRKKEIMRRHFICRLQGLKRGEGLWRLVLMHRIKASQLKQTCAGNASCVPEGLFIRRIHGESRGQYLT